MLSIYVIRKYVKATSVANALKHEKTTAVHDCYMEDLSTKTFLDNLAKLSTPPKEKYGIV